MVSTMTTLNDESGAEVVRRARARFLAGVGSPTEDGCHPWMRKRDAYGYGMICILPVTKEAKAHRVAWVLANGPIPLDRPVIRHTCDHPWCVNPEHLLCGTMQDNCQDMGERGRRSAGRGIRHRKAKLTGAQIAEIRQLRAAGTSCADLGRRFSVGRDQISRICTGKVWRHIS